MAKSINHNFLIPDIYICIYKLINSLVTIVNI